MTHQPSDFYAQYELRKFQRQITTYLNTTNPAANVPGSPMNTLLHDLNITDSPAETLFTFNFTHPTVREIKAECITRNAKFSKCITSICNRAFYDPSYGVDQEPDYREMSRPENADYNTEIQSLIFLDSQRTIVDWTLSIPKLKTLGEDRIYDRDLMKSCLVRLVNTYHSDMTTVLSDKSADEIATFLIKLDSKRDKQLFYRSKLYSLQRNIHEDLQNALTKAQAIIDCIYPPTDLTTASYRAAAYRIAIISFLPDQLAISLLAKLKHSQSICKPISDAELFTMAMEFEIFTKPTLTFPLQYGREINNIPISTHVQLNNAESSTLSNPFAPFLNPFQTFPYSIPNTSAYPAHLLPNPPQHQVNQQIHMQHAPPAPNIAPNMAPNMDLPNPPPLPLPPPLIPPPPQHQANMSPRQNLINSRRTPHSINQPNIDNSIPVEDSHHDQLDQAQAAASDPSDRPLPTSTITLPKDNSYTVEWDLIPDNANTRLIKDNSNKGRDKWITNIDGISYYILNVPNTHNKDDALDRKGKTSRSSSRTTNAIDRLQVNSITAQRGSITPSGIYVKKIAPTTNKQFSRNQSRSPSLNRSRNNSRSTSRPTSRTNSLNRNSRTFSRSKSPSSNSSKFPRSSRSPFKTNSYNSRDSSRDRSVAARKNYPHMLKGLNCSPNYDPTKTKKCSKCPKTKDHHEFDCGLYYKYNVHLCDSCKKYRHFASDCQEISTFPPKNPASKN